LKPRQAPPTREISVPFAGEVYYFHPGGGGNPEWDNAVKLIAKWLPETISGPVALIECGQGYLARLMAERGAEVQSFHSNWIDYSYAEKNGAPANRFTDFARTDPQRQFDHIFFRSTKSATHNLNIITHALTALTPEGKLHIAGGNKDGIKGLAAKLSRRGVETEMVANGKGCRILACPKCESFPMEDLSLEASYQFHQSSITIQTLPGLFAHGKSDRGTALLLENLPNCKDKKVLDLGCGSGVLGLGALQGGAAALTATDISAMALDATTQNLADFPNKSILPTYIGDSLIGRFNIILTNPPFHEGKATRYPIGEEWLDRCRGRLSRKGVVWLVANEFLKYRTWGESRFSSVERIATRDRFAVYKMTV
jgi:16S rRNA (guanine1207-N2)-methyltransferase